MSKDLIEIREKPSGAKPYIAGTRIRVSDIAGQYSLAEEAGVEPVAYIAAAYPHLNLEEIKAAISYWRSHKSEIDAEIAADVPFGPLGSFIPGFSHVQIAATERRLSQHPLSIANRPAL